MRPPAFCLIPSLTVLVVPPPPLPYGLCLQLALEGYVRAQGELASVSGKLEALEALLADPASPLASTQVGEQGGSGWHRGMRCLSMSPG